MYTMRAMICLSQNYYLFDRIGSRNQFPQYVGPSYMLAFGYVFMDSAYAGYKMWNAKDDDPVSTTTTGGGRSKEVKTAIATVDSLIWQSEFVCS